MSETPPITSQVTAAALKPRADLKPGLRIIEIFVWVFESPRWLLNVILAALIAGFVPIVGQIVVMGYLFACLEDQIRAPRFGYPDFELNQFVNYLKRGVYAWLVYFLLSLLGVALVMMIYFPMVLTAVGLLNTRDQMWMLAGGFLLAFAYLVYIVLLIAVSVAPTPLILRVGLTENIRDALQWRWALSFLRKLLPELVLSVMVISICMVPLALIAFPICLIGPIVLTGVYYFMGIRLMLQLYEIFLARGGEPIPLPVRPAPVMPPAPPEKLSPFMAAPG